MEILKEYGFRHGEYFRTIEKIESIAGIQTISYLLKKETGLNMEEYQDIALKIKAKQKSLEL